MTWMMQKAKGLLQAAGTPAGGSGPGVAGSPPGGQNPNPSAGAGAGAPSPGAGAAATQPGSGAGAPGVQQDNPIPYSRHREMLDAARREAAAEAERAFMERYGPSLQRLEGFDPDSVKAGIAASILEGLGIKREAAPPQYVTREELERIRAEDGQRYQRNSDLQRAKFEMDDAKAGRHREWFEADPTLEEEVAAIWGSPWAMKQKLTVGQIVDARVKAREALIAKKNEAYAAQKKGDQTFRPVSPGGTGQPAPGAGTKGPNLGNDDEAHAAAVAFINEHLSRTG